MFDSIIIGGGPAGLAAAKELMNQGCKNFLLVERDHELGGILNQCIHNGFGLHTFKEELTGPEYAQRYINDLSSITPQIQLNSMVLSIDSTDKIKKVHVASKQHGYQILETKTIILAMGARERTRFMIQIPGTRPAGIMSAGTAQRLINIEGHSIGKEIVILGSGDIGLIMARRLTLNGSNVKMVCELESYSNGLNRNLVQCLQDYDIPLKLSHTVVEVHGKNRLEGVTIAEVDEHKQPIPSTYQYISCDTLLLSVGLIPENELSKTGHVELHPKTKGPVVDEHMETSIEGIFACGNVVHIHDLVDNVSKEAVKAAQHVIAYLQSPQIQKVSYPIETKEGIGYSVPKTFYQTDESDQPLEILFRVTKNQKNVKLVVMNQNGEIIKEFRRQVVAPGEMETIRLNRELLKNVTSLSIALKEM